LRKSWIYVQGLRYCQLKEAEEIVRAKLQNQSIEEIVAQLEYVYRNYNSSDWWDEGGRALAGGLAAVGGGMRGNMAKDNFGEDGEDGEIELRDFAEELLEKLAEIWGDVA